MKLVLGDGVSGRRTGLSRNINSSLLKSINASSVQNRAAMPRGATKKATVEAKAESIAKRAVDEEEDINRPPDSDSDEEFRRANNEDIKGTVFVTGAERREEQKKNDAVARGGRKGAATGIKDAPRNGRTRRGKISPTSSPSTSSPKRKSQGDGKPLGAGMADTFGRPKIKKPRISFLKKKPSQNPLKDASGLWPMLLFVLNLR